MLKNDRITFIQNYIKKNKTVKVGFLSEQLQVTPETVRKDLEYMEEQGALKRVHGGAVLHEKNITETNFLVRESINNKEKELLAIEACQFVKEGDFIALDVSTTNTEIAKQLTNTFERLSIITNSLLIATIVSSNPSFTVYLPGGKLRNSELCIIGASCISYIHQFHIDTFFMSVSGISLEKGLLDYGIDELEVKLAMFQNSTTKYVVADHTKFETTAMLRIGDISSVNGIITDPFIPSKLVKQYEEKGIPIFHS